MNSRTGTAVTRSWRTEQAALGTDLWSVILRDISDGRWFDFGRFSAASVQRRVERRMRQQSIASLSDYLALLHADRDEARALRAELLGNGSSYFRDHQAWDFIAQQLVPRVIAHARPSRSVRVWLPCCGAGADAYLLAMLLDEHQRATHSGVAVQVFASEADDRLLDLARTGWFPSISATALGRSRLDRFFVASRKGYQAKRDLRQMIVFAHHDLFADVPFSHLDLVCCRYLFTHLRPAAQTWTARLLHRALDDGGYLVLGPGEQIEESAGLFEVASRRWSVYHRTGGGQDPAPLGELRAVAWKVGQSPEPIRAVAPSWDGHAPEARDHANLTRLLRVMTMGRLAASLAHELSQPLAAMANLLEACAARLRGGTAHQAQLLDLIGQATSQSDRANRIIAHVTRLLHDGDRRVERCELRTLAATAAELVRPTLRQHGIELQLALGATPLRAEVCRVEVEQVLMNLLQNAVDAVIGNDLHRRRIRVELSPAQDGFATITVADSGSGIPHGMAERIFEPFFTTKTEGFGMGLAICRSIATAHGGRLWTERCVSPDLTRMCFALPLADAEQAEPEGT